MIFQCLFLPFYPWIMFINFLLLESELRTTPTRIAGYIGLHLTESVIFYIIIKYL